MKTTEEIVNLLNRAIKKDPEAIQSIMDHRVPTKFSRWDNEDPWILGHEETIGPLGIINGLIKELLGETIAASYTKDGKLTHFMKFEERE
jgi:hypothetical protein